MNCERCRGACCESMTIPAADLRPPGRDEMRWIELHATKSHGNALIGPELTFECRCTALTREGRCGIYETRPAMCRTYRPGGPDCLETVRTRRTAADYQRIRDVDDPPCLDHYREEVTRVGDPVRSFLCIWCGDAKTEPWAEARA